jgi:mercuric ion binding protein
MKPMRKTVSAVLLSLLLVAVPASADDDLKTAHLIVDGMVTSACPLLVKTALRKLEGVESVEASVETKRVSVSYRPAAVNVERIREVLLDQVGFSAQTIEVAHFEIDGMTTANCPVLVRKAVADLPDIVEVDADLKTMSATVAFVAGTVTAERIAETILDRVGLQATYVPGR